MSAARTVGLVIGLGLDGTIGYRVALAQGWVAGRQQLLPDPRADARRRDLEEAVAELGRRLERREISAQEWRAAITELSASLSHASV